MTYTLILGDRTYSSWSLRAWLVFEKFGLPYRLDTVSFGESGEGWAAIDAHPPAKTVPTLITPEGAVIDDSLALAEELATRHPAAGLWPDDPFARATARTLAAEMHSSFAALREDCPMNLRVAYHGYQPSQAVLDDVARIDRIWIHAMDRIGGDWLCGDYSVADAFYAPIAARIATYGLQVSDRAGDYVQKHLHDPAFRRWRAMAHAKGEVLPWYKRDFDLADWPGPQPLPAVAEDGTECENDVCPYSGLPVTHVLNLDNRRFGFCNAFCRDKTVADPEAWPKFMAIYQK